mmetsp:Transcript_15998/g.29299  ORF Transcript_15998/g.29299 Transcript_15998/m.29299 type:complete len:252 (-) Transcript_15998:1246-2001(-)
MELVKEPGYYFHLSLDGQPVSDIMNPFTGFYKMPTLAYYGANYPSGDLITIVKGNAAQFRLPAEVMRLLEEGFPSELPGTLPKGKRMKGESPPMRRFSRPEEIRFVWIVNDLSTMAVTKGLVLNLVNHSWAFEGVPERRVTRDLPTCIVPIEGVDSPELNGVSIGSWRCEYLSMHLKKGAIAISPNSHKLVLQPNAKFWTLTVHDELPLAYVSLQYVITDPSLAQLYLQSSTLQELVSTLQDPLINELFSA